MWFVLHPRSPGHAVPYALLDLEHSLLYSIQRTKCIDGHAVPYALLNSEHTLLYSIQRTKCIDGHAHAGDCAPPAHSAHLGTRTHLHMALTRAWRSPTHGVHPRMVLTHAWCSPAHGAQPGQALTSKWRSPSQVFALHPGMVLTDVTRSLPYLVRKGNELIMGLLLLTPAEGEAQHQT